VVRRRGPLMGSAVRGTGPRGNRPEAGGAPVPVPGTGGAWCAITSRRRWAGWRRWCGGGRWAWLAAGGWCPAAGGVSAGGRGRRRGAVGCSARVMRVVAAARVMVPPTITRTAHSGSPAGGTADGGGGGPGGGSDGGGVAEAAGAPGGCGGQEQRERAEGGQRRRAAGRGRLWWRAPGRGCGPGGWSVMCGHSLPAAGPCGLGAAGPPIRACGQHTAGWSERRWAWRGGWVGIGVEQWWNWGEPAVGGEASGRDLGGA